MISYRKALVVYSFHQSPFRHIIFIFIIYIYIYNSFIWLALSSLQIRATLNRKTKSSSDLAVGQSGALLSIIRKFQSQFQKICCQQRFQMKYGNFVPFWNQNILHCFERPIVHYILFLEGRKQASKEARKSKNLIKLSPSFALKKLTYQILL